MAVGQLWSVNSLGGFFHSDELSNKLRSAVQPLVMFRQFCDARDGAQKAKKKGELFHWDIYSDISSQGTTLIETTTMPESNFTVTQGTLTVTEYGNSVPYTGKLDNFSQFDVETIINKVLKNDAKKAFDIAAHAQFNATLLRVVPASSGTATDAITLTTNGTATGTNNVALGKNHVKVIVDTMKERNIPPYMDNDYFTIAHPTTYRTFKNELESVHQYVNVGFQQILNGEIGRYESTRFIDQNNIAKDAFTNAKSNWAFFFGEDTVMEAIVVPEEMRGKIPTDFGRSMGVAWYYLGGFGLVHSATASQARIVKWDSAA